MASPKLIAVQALLSATKDQTLKFFDLSEEQLSRTYGAGKWSIKQILHHLTDSELIFHERLKRIIAEPKQVIWAYNQELWNDVFNYEHEPLGNKKAVYELCRDMNYTLAEKYFDKYADKEFVHSEAGLRIFKDEFERVALHNDAHNQQMQKALSGL